MAGDPERGPVTGPLGGRRGQALLPRRGRSMCRSRSLHAVSGPADSSEAPGGSSEERDSARGRAGSTASRLHGAALGGPETVRLPIRPELINRGGLLSGVVTYAMVDYCMGSTLWAQTTERGAHRDDQHLDQLHPDGDRGRDRLPLRCSTGATARIGILQSASSRTRTAACW